MTYEWMLVKAGKTDQWIPTSIIFCELRNNLQVYVKKRPHTHTRHQTVTVIRQQQRKYHLPSY